MNPNGLRMIKKNMKNYVNTSGGGATMGGGGYSNYGGGFGGTASSNMETPMRNNPSVMMGRNYISPYGRLIR
jgi:hypothetical protein